jgi:hypothetical protein
MDKLIENGRKIDKALDSKAKRYVKFVTPLAALTNAKIEGDQALVQSLMSESLTTQAEIRQLTKRNRSEMKEPQAVKQIISQIAESNLGSSGTDFNRQVKLIAAMPKNEFDLLADYVYKHSNLTRDEIVNQIDGWTYEQKAAALKTIARSESAALLGRINYRFDVLDSIVDLEGLSKRLLTTEVQVQPPTPRYGYRVPSVVEEAGIEELFIESFDISLELYSDIQSAGLAEIASYAVLMGHRQRWQLSATAEQVFRSAAELDVIKSLKEQIAEVHPLISSKIEEIVNQAQIDGKKESPEKQSITKPARNKNRRTKSQK